MNVPAVGIALPCGKTAWVSPEDHPRVAPLSWSDKGSGYVRARWKRSAGGDGGTVLLHRFILDAPKGMVVDHIDGNPLNNTRGNLQITTQSRNLMKARGMRGGVTRARKRWRARIRIDGRHVSLGCYDTKEQAVAIVEHVRRHIWQSKEINPLGTVSADVPPALPLDAHHG